MTLYARINPDTSTIEVRDFGTAPSAAKGWLLLILVDPPTPGPTQVATLSVVIANNVATQVWTLREKTAAELEAEDLQNERAQIDGYIANIQTQLDISNAARAALTNAQRINELERDTRATMKAAKYMLRQSKRAL